jgi:hypothetical protein
MTVVPILDLIKCEAKRKKWLLDSVGTLGTCAYEDCLLILKYSLLKYIHVVIVTCFKSVETGFLSVVNGKNPH